MTFINTNETTIFAKNAKPIAMTGGTDTSTYLFEIGEIRFQFKTHSGNATISLRDILTSWDFTDLRNTTGKQSIDSVTITIFEQGPSSSVTQLYTSTHYVVPGGIPEANESEDFFDKNWLTWQNQIRNINRTAEELLTAVSIFVSSTCIGRTTAKVKVYMERSGIYEAPIIISAHADYIIVQVSELKIRGYFTAAGISIPSGEKISAADFTFQSTYQGVTTNSYIQRYIFIDDHKANYRQFLWRNSIGGWDNLTSRGRVRELPDYEIQTFVHSREELELENNDTMYLEVNTGQIRDEYERGQWLDFLSSKERYILDGSAYKRIVIDESTVEHTLLQRNSASFKFHYSKKENGRFKQRSPLDPYCRYVIVLGDEEDNTPILSQESESIILEDNS